MFRTKDKPPAYPLSLSNRISNCGVNTIPQVGSTVKKPDISAYNRQNPFYDRLILSCVQATVRADDQNPPLPPFRKGGNSLHATKLSPFSKGGQGGF